jgi:hypothetical protein
MGIRIHKILGYALTDVQADTDKWEITDPRFNKDGYLFDPEEVKFSVDGFKAYLTRKILASKEDDENDERFDLKLILRGLEKNPDDMFSRPIRGLYDCINYDMEFGDPKVLVVVPPSCTKEWSRYDDAIDYYDPVNQSADGGIEPSVIHLDRPLWPWDTLISTKTMPPKPLNHFQSQAYYLWKNGHIVTDEDLYAEKIGFETIEEMKRYVMPIIPLEVVELLKYLKIFNDEKTIYELRPVIYGYWG